MPSRTAKRNPPRRQKMKTSINAPRIMTSAIISSIDATAADTIQITFNTRVMLRSEPNFTAGAGGAETVASATEISDTVIELSFTGDVQGTTLNVPEGSNGIRTAAAGFVPAGSYAIPTFP